MKALRSFLLVPYAMRNYIHSFFSFDDFSFFLKNTQPDCFCLFWFGCFFVSCTVIYAEIQRVTRFSIPLVYIRRNFFLWELSNSGHDRQDKNLWMTQMDLVWFYVCTVGKQGFSWKKQAKVLFQKLKQQLIFNNCFAMDTCQEKWGISFL